jgi:hypothetical protein
MFHTFTAASVRVEVVGQEELGVTVSAPEQPAIFFRVPTRDISRLMETVYSAPLTGPSTQICGVSIRQTPTSLLSITTTMSGQEVVALVPAGLRNELAGFLARVRL